jgi:ankyrin repeat protein
MAIYVNLFLFFAIGGHVDVCELLLHSGANVNAQNHAGDTALHLAS